MAEAMTWELACAWLREMALGADLLGIYRATSGPGPFSIYIRRRGRVLEAWAVAGGTLQGKWWDEQE